MAKRSSLPPGPVHPAAIQTLHFGLRPYAFLEDCARRFGDVFTLRIVGLGTLVAFSRPEAIQEIFAVGSGAGSSTLAPLLGPRSLFALEGERHLAARRLVMPAFRGERMHVYGRLMREVTDRAVARWPLGRPFPAHRALQSVALDVILRAVFGMDEPERTARLRVRLLRFLALFDGRLGSLVMLPAFQLDLGRLSPWGRVRHRIRAIDALLFEEIARRRAEGDVGREDVLSLLAFARDERGGSLSDAALRDQMFALLLAGHETTATSMAWALDRILRRPDVVARIRSELGRVVGIGDLEPEHVAKLEYLDAVVKESARLHPVLPEVGRELEAPARIGGVDLPAGVTATAAVYLVHRRPDLWREPERFEPERFLGLRPSPFAYLPFGGGVRRCVGASFASYEMKVVLARILAQLDLELASGAEARVMRRAVACTPSRGVPIVVRARRS
jgi:cytochrome P450